MDSGYNDRIICYSTTYFQMEKQNLVSFTVSQHKLSFAWELPFQYLEVYKMHLENVLLWKMESLN